MSRPARRLVLALAAACALGTLGAAPALATTPGLNGRIAFGSAGDIWTVQPDGSGQQQVTSGPEQDEHPTWSPDGRAIAFARDGDIWRVVPGAAPQVLRATDDFLEFFPAFSPDGLRIAFNRQCALPLEADCGDLPRMEANVVVARLDGPGETAISQYGARPAWSPDGARIAWGAGDSGPVWVGRADGSEAAPLAASLADHRDPSTGFVGADRQPTWSPDGARLAYWSDRGEGGQWITSVRTDSTDLRRLQSDVPASVLGPSWSPDGRLIAFDGGDGQVWTMGADGAGPRAITSGLPPGITGPSWQTLPSPAVAGGGTTIIFGDPEPVPFDAGTARRVQYPGLRPGNGVRLVAPARVRRGRPLTLTVRLGGPARKVRLTLQERGRRGYRSLTTVTATAPRTTAMRVALRRLGPHTLRVAFRSTAGPGRSLPVVVRVVE